MVVSSCDLLYFQSVLLEELDFLGSEVGSHVAMAESSNFLLKHPVKHALFATIAPGVNIPLCVESNRVIVTCGEVLHFNISFNKRLDNFRGVEADIVFITMS